MSLRKKAISSFFWTGLKQFGTQLISFAVFIVLARILFPKDFGLIGMIAIVVALAKAFLDSGLSQSLIRSKTLEDIDYSTVFYFNLWSSLFLYGVVFLIAPYVSMFYDKPELTSILRWYSLSFVLYAFGNIQQVRIVKNLEFKKLFKITVPAIFMGGSVGVYMAYHGYGVWSLVGSAIVQAGAASILLWFLGNWTPKFAFCRERFSFHFKYGYKLMVSGVIDTLYNNSYAVLIGKFFTVDQLGYYTRADSLTKMPVQNVGAVLNKVTFPLFATIQDDDVRLQKAYQKIMQIVTMVIAPLLLFMAALGEPLFQLLLTEKWLPAVPYFKILCWIGILYPINSYNLNILKVKGRSDLFLKLELIKKGIGAVIIVGTISYGISALLVGAVFTSVLAFFINTYYTGKFINYSTWQQMKDVFPLILFSFIAASLISFCSEFYRDTVTHNSVRILLFGSMGLVVYLLFLWVFQRTIVIEALKIIRNK